MQRMLRQIGALLCGWMALGSVGLVACGDDDPQSGKMDFPVTEGDAEVPRGISGLVDELLALRNERAETYCECFEELGCNSASACINRQEPVGPSMRECIDRAFMEDRSASSVYLECIVNLHRNFATCLNQRLMCSASEDGLEACQRDFGVGLPTCIELPPVVQRNLSNCGYNRELNFVRCDDGGGGGAGCTNTCRYASDGECDDGRPGADTRICDLGTDCNDCGI